MNKYLSETDFMSIFIPRVFANITKERITHIVENVVPLGTVERIDIVEIDEKTNRVWVHFSQWYDTEFANEFKKLLVDGTKQAKIVYDEPWYWIVLKNTHRLANGQPKIRLDLEDGEIVQPTQVSSPKSFVTFTTSKKTSRDIKWADVESDTDEDTVPIVRPVSPPCPPPYPNPYQQPIMYQIPYPMYYEAPPIAPGIPFWLCQQPQFPPIAPTLSFQHPVSSWNGMPYPSDPYIEYQEDELYMFDIEDDEAFLTEGDYQQIMDEIDNGDLYSDEDLYNMYLMEKEELDLINQTGASAEPIIDVFVEYGNVYETSGLGFDEETIAFGEHGDAPLVSDGRVPETPTTSPLSQRLFNAMSRPIQEFKDIKDRVYESSPLLRSLSIKSAMRPIMSYKSAVVSTR